MPDLHEFWEPDEWEQFAFGLLQDRHGALNVMKVPARHLGDFGLDYYCLADRVVYQCYAVQDPCEVADRADKQKSKITTDLKKFCGNKKEIQGLLGDVKVNRWILTVPIHDSSQVNIHLTTKATEVKNLGLNYVTPDFEVLIHDLSCFDAGSLSYRTMLRSSVSVPTTPPTAQEIDNWVMVENPLVLNLIKKLRKRIAISDQAQIDAQVREAIGWFLEKENALQTLRGAAPQLYETLVGVISRRTTRLQLYGPPPDGAAHHILRTETESLVAELKMSVPNFTAESAEQLALGAVAEWLLRCPLDFPPYDHAA
jgi:hypothetical protein